MGDEGLVLVVGASGQIGSRLLRFLERRGCHAVGTYHRNDAGGLLQLDASDPGQVSEVFAKVSPAVVVNAMNAPGGTDACELDPALAERSHFETGRVMADEAVACGARIVQISTDYVFDGESGPYRETDPPKPISNLGRAKLRLEEYLLRKVPGSLVVRTSFVFSWTPQSKTRNFVMQLLEGHRERRHMKVPIDQVGNVTYAPSFGEALVEMIHLNFTGLYHLAGTDRCSKYDWALSVAEFFGLDAALIHGVTTAELQQAGPRPLESGFVLDKARAALRETRLASLEEGLADMKREMTAGAPRS